LPAFARFLRDKIPPHRFGNPFQRGRKLRLAQGFARFVHLSILRKSCCSPKIVADLLFSREFAASALLTANPFSAKRIAGAITSASFIVP